MIIKCATYDIETTTQPVQGKKRKYDPSPYNKKNFLLSFGVQTFDVVWDEKAKQIINTKAFDTFTTQATTEAFNNIKGRLDQSELVIGHFIKFDLLWSKSCGLVLTNKPTYDTGIAEFVLARGQRVDLDLDSVAKRYGLPGKEDTVSGMIKSGVSPSEIVWELLEPYLEIDLDRTTNVFLEQIKRNNLDLQQLAHM